MLTLKEDSMISCPVDLFNENDINLNLIIFILPNWLGMWVDLLFVCGIPEEKYYWRSLEFSGVNLKNFQQLQEINNLIRNSADI